MKVYRFFHPIEVRYGDLDPQGHVNNAKYLTYLEQARIAYFIHLGLRKGNSFMDLGVILADIHITYKVPIIFGQAIHVGVVFTKLGNKSMHVEQKIENPQSGQIYATANIVLVAYDYHNQQTVSIPDHWRKTIDNFENNLISL